MSKYKRVGYYTADFEATNNPDDCFVWSAILCDIESESVKKVYYNIDTFMRDLLKLGHAKVYFHNLKYDSQFIISWLLEHRFKWSKDPDEYCFNTLITAEGVYYTLTIYLDVSGKYHRYNKIEIIDSLKLIPLPVREIAKAYKMDIQKGEIDYNKPRKRGYIATPQEIDYIKKDALIMARALNLFIFKEGYKKITLGSNALNVYKKMLGPKYFDAYFPVLPPEIDTFCRKSYKGGYVYLNPKYAQKDMGAGITLDVNSLYPSRMYFEKLPYGLPFWFNTFTELAEHPQYDLYIVNIMVDFTLKEGHLPTLQIKGNARFVSTEYVTTSNNEIVELTMTSVDFELFKQHYNTHYLVVNGGWAFKSRTGLFTKYIDHYMEIKKNAQGGIRLLAKLFLNNLYGKFGLNPNGDIKVPYLDDAGVVKYETMSAEERETIFVPLASFVTAYARRFTITSAQKVYDRFIYADTDSLHLIGKELPDGLEIDDVELGMWKIEESFVYARYLRPKTYYEKLDDGTLKVTCAGMPENVKKLVNEANFKVGAIFDGKLQHKVVKGGAILQDTTFKIN